MSWWNKLTELQKLYASFAIPATLLMLIQFILQLVGFVGGGGADSADSGDAGGEIDVADGADGIDIGDAGGGIDLADGVDGIDIGDAGGGIDLADGVDGIDIGDAGGGIDLADGVDGIDIGDAGDGIDVADGAGETGAADLHTGLQFSGESSGGISGAEAHGTVGDASENPGIGDGEGHEKANALRLFSIRSIVAFFAVGGWTGIAAIDRNASAALSVALALIAGWIALYFVAWIIGVFLRMQQSGNIRLENAVGADGEVYLTIPAKGIGKINVIVQERLCEFNAVTEAGRAIKTGEKITVVGVASEGVLVVAPKASAEGAVVKSNN